MNMGKSVAGGVEESYPRQRAELGTWCYTEYQQVQNINAAPTGPPFPVSTLAIPCELSRKRHPMLRKELISSRSRCLSPRTS